MASSLRLRRPWAPAIAAVVCVACTSIDPDASLVLRCPDAVEFERVAPFVESSCGTLDCHGQLARPMRVYGERGLRLSSGDVAGGEATTPQERDATLRSLCALEPERTAKALAGQLAAEELLVVGKGRGEVEHKGGQLMVPGDDADRCMTSWLSGAADLVACDRVAVP